MPRRPTEDTYAKMQEAFDFLNQRLFKGSLAQCLITMQRRKRSYGYFSSDRFRLRSGKKTTHEIALNPMAFDRSDKDIVATLAHEMVHAWQQEHGNPGRARYHNAEWARKMEEIGLCPSDTGKPGGKKTGDSMTHYIMDGGVYDAAWRELRRRGFRLSWTDAAVESPKKVGGPTRSKYQCPDCGLNAWARDEARLVCGECEVDMRAVGRV